MKSTLEYGRIQYKVRGEDRYATAEDFHLLFATEMVELFRLAVRLTADPEIAERCIIMAMRECIGNSTVSKRWSLIWARRTVIRNAINLVIGIEDVVPSDLRCDVDFHLQPSTQREAIRDSFSILMLPDLDRLVFVICVLEQYSIMDCALLLSNSPRVVNEARERAIKQINSADNSSRLESTTTGPYGNCTYQSGGLDESCGSLLD